MKIQVYWLLTVLLPYLFFSCNAPLHESSAAKKMENKVDQSFKDYWYQGKAELTSYKLKQARYGEQHDGDAVLIFVTEDFLTEQQVKKERKTDENSTSVLKLNFIRKFPTGIYDYSMMNSTFSPIAQNRGVFPLKSSTSSQEWCGQSWLQLNQRNNHYLIKSFSYFQAEADEEKQIDKVFLEDGLWAQLRLNPSNIPLGELTLFPGAHYLRFAHKELKAYTARIALNANADPRFKGEDLMALSIQYPKLERVLTIVYESAFPHQIAGWKETRNSGFGDSAKQMESIAIKNVQLKTPYWVQNSSNDQYFRDSLQLSR